MNREAILTALAAKFVASRAFVTVSRRLALWDDVPASAKPALFLAERGDTYSAGNGVTPGKVTIAVELFICTTQTDAAALPATALNQALDAVDAALAAEVMTGKQSLGGLVDDCCIDGKIFKDPGDLDGSGLAVVPVRILVPV